MLRTALRLRAPGRRRWMCLAGVSKPFAGDLVSCFRTPELARSLWHRFRWQTERAHRGWQPETFVRRAMGCVHFLASIATHKRPMLAKGVENACPANARVSLLATAVNNVALASSVAGFVASLTTGRMVSVSRLLLGAGFDRHRERPTWMRAACAGRLVAMTWDQWLNWLIIPGIAALVIGGGAVWYSRHIP